MSEVDSHLEGLRQLVNEHQLLSQQNVELAQENSLLRKRIEAMAAHARAILTLYSNVQGGEKRELARIFQQTVEEPSFSVRAYNCLKNARINTIGELVQKTEAEVLASNNFGRKTLGEIKEILATQGLRFGMNKDDMLAWIPPDPGNPLFCQ